MHPIKTYSFRLVKDQVAKTLVLMPTCVQIARFGCSDCISDGTGPIHLSYLETARPLTYLIGVADVEQHIQVRSNSSAWFQMNRSSRWPCLPGSCSRCVPAAWACPRRTPRSTFSPAEGFWWTTQSPGKFLTGASVWRTSPTGRRRRSSCRPSSASRSNLF